MGYQEEECLFCEEICSGTTPPSRFLFSGSRYLGKDCQSLESQLKQLFILRRILDVPSKWCEEKLGGSDGVNPSNWFGVCGSCSEIVEEAVDVHHKILKLEGKFQELKEKVKGKMGSGRSKRRRRRGRGGGDGDIKKEIRRMVVGEEVVAKSEVDRPSYNYAEVDMDDDDDDNFDLQQAQDDENSCSDPEWNEEEAVMINDNEDGKKRDQSQSEIPIIMRKKPPGRPPRGEERPRDLYRGKDGKIHRVTFKWRFCLKCPAKFKHKKDLNAHSSLHDSQKKHSCPECCFPCKTKEELERHHKAKHEGRPSNYYNPRYACVSKDCQFVTYTLCQLDSHCANEHPLMPISELKRMKCPRCVRTFGTKKSLGLHQHRWHPELFGKEPLPSVPSFTTTGPIECDQCGLVFASPLHLDNHVRNIHERVQRQICEECGKGFRNKSRLEAHMIVHSKEREFVCQYCGLDYPAKATLDDHIRKIHPRIGSGGDGEGGAKEGSGEGEGSGEIFTCKYCELTSPFKVVIRRHQLTHKVGMGHQCDLCEKCYTSNAGLKRHVRINHPTQVEVVECPYCKKPFGNKDYMNDHMKKFCQVRKDFEGGGAKGGEEKLETIITPAQLPFKIESSGSSDLCDV